MDRKAPGLDILVISDLHYVREADHVCALPQRKSALGPAVLRQALAHLRHRGIEVGLVIMLGDIVDNGLADGADKDLQTVAASARRSSLPLLVIPGNHDGDFERFARIFECGPGLHEVKGYGFLLFHDHVGPEDVTTRPPQGLELPAKVASRNPELPLVALQHNPLHPHIDSRYPYMLTNSKAVLSGYDQSGVILSLSGHYHPGQPAHSVGNVICYTVPAACEEPFPFAHVHLEGREVEVQEHALPHLGWSADTTHTRQRPDQGGITHGVCDQSVGT
jgi:predicted MPP superfamily phosphohydrolase